MATTSDGSAAETFLAGTVASDDKSLYAVGYGDNGEGTENKHFLITKFANDGSVAWSHEFGNTANEALTGVLSVNGRLFAVGYTDAEGHGGKDAVLFEIDPSNGHVLSEQLYGGSANDQADAITTDSPAVVTDALGDSSIAALSRPGSRFLTGGQKGVDHAVRVTQEHMRQQAWADSVAEASNAWKGGSDREIPLRRQTGDAVADAYLDSVDALESAWIGNSGRR